MVTLTQVERRAKAANTFVAVEGLDEIAKGLRQVGKEAQNELKGIYRSGGDLIVNTARPAIPRESGKLLGSVKSAPTSREGRVKMGTPSRVPYAGWVEFGGTILFPRRSRARTGLNYSKSRVRVRERVSVLGGFISTTRRETRVVQLTKRGYRSNRDASGAVVASREFVPEGRALYPAFVGMLGEIRDLMTFEIEQLQRRYDVGP